MIYAWLGLVSINDPDVLYRSILERNRCQLLKSIGSSFGTGPLVNTTGRDGGGQMTHTILDGIIDMDFITIYTNKRR